jgi:hypothetical protein
MNTIERIANDIAMLSNTSLAQLAEILTRDYPTRAEQLTLSVDASFRESLNQIYRELGIASAE